jgi:hypothetical protein
MPSEVVVPPGAHRELLKELFHKYGCAGRPCLREIVAQARGMDLDGTASQETVRRVMKGGQLPRQWGTMYAVYAPLCALANVDPEVPYSFQLVDESADPHPQLEGWKATHKELVRDLWNCALDGQEPIYVISRMPSKSWVVVPSPSLTTAIAS